MGVDKDRVKTALVFAGVGTIVGLCTAVVYETAYRNVVGNKKARLARAEEKGELLGRSNAVVDHYDVK